MSFRNVAFGIVFGIVLSGNQCTAASDAVKENSFTGSDNVTLKIRMEGPYTADVPLQVVCYFKYTPEGVKRMSGAPVELDKELGGVIASLRERGEFKGGALETLLIVPPPNSIKAKALLLVGLGDEAHLSKDLMVNVGETALREAARVGATKVAFAPLIRDQGNSTIDVGDIERAVTTGVLLAYDTDKRMQKEGLAKPYALEQWIVEAGPTYYDSTTVGINHAIEDAKEAIVKRPASKYATGK